MLELTEGAVEAVKGIVSSSEEASETGGLRLVAQRSETGATLEISISTLPGEDDQVIEEEGARLFLEPDAASLLENKVVDAEIQQDRVAFVLDEQGSV